MRNAIRSLALLSLCLFITAFCHHTKAQTLEKIQAKGVITIGVKTDYPPWGMISPEGKIIGFEADLAQLIAQELKVKLKLKAVTSGNRFQFIEDGDVDLLIATVGDTQQRRQRVRMLEPHYYRSGVTALTPKDANIRHWSDLKGQKVCLYGGAYFNKTLIQEYQIEPLILFNTRDAQLALLTQKCLAWAYDNGAIYHLLKSDNWRQYEAQLPIIYPIQWSIALAKGEESQTLATRMETILIDWQRQGTLYQFAKKWALPELDFLAKKQQIWQQKDDTGQYLCRFDHAHQLADHCDQSPDDTLSESNSWWPFDQHDTHWLFNAFIQTLLFTIAVVLLTLLFTYVFSLFALLRNPYLRKAVSALVNIQRSVPPIVLLYLLYFGLFSINMNQAHPLQMVIGKAVTTALLVLALYTGAGISSLLEESLASPLSNPSNTRNLAQLKQAFLHCQHGVIANLINLVKASAMASALSVPNAILVTTSLVASQGHTVFLMTLLLIFYLVEVMLFSKTLEYLFHKLAQ